jgi:hypothetical protein
VDKSYHNQSKRVGQIWRKLPSGIIVPTGKFEDASSHYKTNFIEIRKHAEELENFYKDAGIRLTKNSGLGTLISNAKELCDNCLLKKNDNLSHKMLFLGMDLDRIVEAVLPLKYESEKTSYLKKLLSGTLDFFERKKSKAKSALWELEIWSWLLKKTQNARLGEPDITVNYAGSRIGIACKKLYSERHVQNVLSEAVKQIEKGFEFGIVAINIDDLLPENVVLKSENSNAASERLFKNNDEFLRRNGRHFEKYFSTDRLISAIISTSAIVDTPSEKPQFKRMYQRLVWTVYGLSTGHKKILDKFYNSVMN